MRHLKKGRKLSRTRNKRRSLFRNLMFQLIMRERIATSVAKAKELRPKVERLITMAKSGTLASRKNLAERLPAEAAKKLMVAIAPRFSKTGGGYTRILKTGPRRSDSSKQAIIELLK